MDATSQWLLEEQASVNCVRQVGQCAEPIINQFDRSSFVIYYELMACHDLSKIAFFCTTTHTQLFIPRKSDNFEVVVFLQNHFLEAYKLMETLKNRHFMPRLFLIGPIFLKKFLLVSKSQYFFPILIDRLRSSLVQLCHVIKLNKGQMQSVNWCFFFNKDVKFIYLF